MQYIHFTPTAKPISDYDIETTFQELKDKRKVKISSNLLFYRFRVAVKRAPSTPTNDVYNIIISNSSHFSIKA